ncbi:hypothetical protein A4X09_0g5528 [Tilletia walkeri]|uniref:Uncharacterized protein n=1 Tax=Tilletia walkeri TaxID=117179 RepID=A0A8X7N6S7_9BASI|nr:hypothetical protein A4X09_0g5528 [Tilletia walkeri]
MATPQEGTATLVPVISTWTAGSSTWTATDHWSTVYGNGGAAAASTPTVAPTAGVPPAAATLAATATASISASADSTSSAPSRADRKPDRSRLNAMAIMSARNKAVAAQASSTAASGAGSGAGAWTKLGGQWVLPSTGQIFAGGQDVTLSWRSSKRPSDSTMLRLCVLKNEGDLRAVQSGLQGSGSCGTPTTPSIMSGAQPGIWSISFTAPNVTIADSFYVLLTKGGASPSPTKTSKASKTTSTSKSKATQSSSSSKNDDRKDRKQDRESSKNGDDEDEDEGEGDEGDEDGYSGGSDDDDNSGGGDEEDGGDGEGDEEDDGGSWDSKGWSSLRRERRSHDAEDGSEIGSGSGYGTESGSGNGSEDDSTSSDDPGSLLSPAFVLAPYGSNTNPAVVQMAAVSPGASSAGSGDGTVPGLGGGASSASDVHRPALNVAAVVIPVLLAGLALVGCLALLMYRRGRKRASEEAEKVRRTETDAREKAKAEMREFLRRSPSGASSSLLNGSTGMGAGGMYYHQQSLRSHPTGRYVGSQHPHFRRSMMTPSPSYQSGCNHVGSGLPYHSASLKSYGYAYDTGAGVPQHVPGGGTVPILAYQDRGAFSVRSVNEGLQARNSMHSLSSGKSFASASSGVSLGGGRMNNEDHLGNVRIFVPTPPPQAPTPPRQQIPTPPPPVYVNTRTLTPPLPPPTPPKDDSHLYHRGAGVGETGVPLVRSGSQGINQQGLPTVTFTSPTASSPTSSLWARVVNPFTTYGGQQQQQQYGAASSAINAQNMAQFQAQAQAQALAQAQAHVNAASTVNSHSSAGPGPTNIPIQVYSPLSTYSSVSSGPGNVVRPMTGAQIPMIQPPIPAALGSSHAVHLPHYGHGQEQVITMTVPSALGYDMTGQQQQQQGSSIPSVLRNGSLKMMQGGGGANLPNPF